MWRLTVRDSQGELIFGPRVYLSDRTMIAAVGRWEGQDRSLLREFATRGAWQDVDAVPCKPIPCPPFEEMTLTLEPWHEEAPICPDGEMSAQDRAYWDSLSPEEIEAIVAKPLVVPGLPEIQVKRGSLRWPAPSEVQWCCPEDIELPSPGMPIVEA